MTPGAARADVRGRQGLAAGRRAVHVAVTIAFTAPSGDNAAWPWVLAVLPALLGGAAVPAGVATGVVLADHLGRRATRRLDTRQPGVLKVLADAAR